jgi:hypothetical protein
MARRIRARDPRDAGTAARATAISTDDRAAVITNIWTLTSRSAKQIGKTLTGETSGPPPALRAVFRASSKRSAATARR